jgi:glycerophosphoryl diester phosphodiesterase
VAERAHAVVIQTVAPGAFRPHWCGSLDAMRLLRSTDPDAPLWLPWSAMKPPGPADLDPLRPVTVNLPFAVVDAELVRDIHALGQTVTVWTVDDPAEMRRAIEMGVDTITTNRVSELQRVIAERVSA